MTDQYQKAIAEEEERYQQLGEKKKKVQDLYSAKKKAFFETQQKEEELSQKQQREEKRRQYLEHKTDYKRHYLWIAARFSVVCSLSLVVILFFLQMLDTGMGIHSFSLTSPLEMIPQISVMVVMLGAVEYRSVSGEFYEFIQNYDKDIYEVLENLENQQIQNKKRQEQLQKELQGEEELLIELEQIMSLVQSNITHYRQTRNHLIEELLEHLDDYVPALDYQPTDIQKIMEKKIP